MTKIEQETYLQTIRARLERNEAGDIKAIFDKNGSWDIVSRTNTGLIRYFTPEYKQGVDPYGNIINELLKDEK